MTSPGVIIKPHPCRKCYWLATVAIVLSLLSLFGLRCEFEERADPEPASKMEPMKI